MKKHLLTGILAGVACTALMSSCIESYTADYVYTLYVSGEGAEANRGALAAYLEELGAPAPNGSMPNGRALKPFSGKDAADAAAACKAHFETIVSRIDYSKIKELGLQYWQQYRYEASDLHGNVIAEWRYPNADAGIDTVVVKSLLTVRMEFSSTLAACCDIKVLCNGEELPKTNDSIFEGNYRVTEYPQDAVFTAQITKKDGAGPAADEGIQTGCIHRFLLTNRNAAGEILSTSREYDWNHGYTWHYMLIPGKNFDKWLEKYGTAEIARFHIDGTSTLFAN